MTRGGVRGVLSGDCRTYAHGKELAAADQPDFGVAPCGRFIQVFMQIVDAGQGRGVPLQHDVAALQGGFDARLNLADHDGTGVRVAAGALDTPVETDGLSRHAQTAAANAAIAHQLQGDVERGVYADGETDALGAAGHGGVDADDTAMTVDQGAAGIAGIERCVGLDNAVDQPAGIGAQGAAQGADDTGRDGRLIAQRIADGDDQLADAKRGRAAEVGVDQVAAGDAQDGEVRFRIVADKAGFEIAAVGQGDAKMMGAGDDVAVGHQVAVGREQDGGAMTALQALDIKGIDLGNGGAGAIESARYQFGIGIEDDVVVNQGCVCHGKRGAGGWGGDQPGYLAGTVHGAAWPSG